jgi:hypothetical protein
MDTILVTLIALTFILGSTGTPDGAQNMVRLLYVSLVTAGLLTSHWSGVHSSPATLERIGSMKPSDAHGKQEKSVKPIKPLLPDIIGKK